MPADSEIPPFSAVGGDAWLGADEYEPGSPLHTRATDFLKSIKWDVLAGIASKNRGGISCCYEDKFSIGHFNMVRRINFEDGVGYVARLRLPDEGMSADNAVGAPYILMEYIHGSVASELRQAKSCELQMFGTPEQDRKFREQMAQIQATVASFRFPKIGSLYHDPNTDEFYIGPKL
jgi:hypothetical protein